MSRDINNNELPINGADARILQIEEGKFIISYNTWINQNDVTTGRDNKNCASGCALIATRLAELNDKQQLFLRPEYLLCPEYSNAIEKNWSFWVDNRNGLHFSYGLYPNHEIFNLQIVENQLKCSGDYFVGSSDFLTAFSKYYNNKIFISVTTPAIQFRPNEWLGVGHVKYKHRDVENFPLTPLYNFTKLMHDSGKKFHPIYIYLMYFYLFDHLGRLTHVSNMFLPRSDTVLCFPSGLTFMSNANVLVSYGDADEKCKCFAMTPEQLEKQLIPVGVAPFIPEHVNFFMM